MALGLAITAGFAQEGQKEREPGHENTNRFRQMYYEMATPNAYRTASGQPGPEYYQQQADYVMDIELDDRNQKIYGTETITYHNNSPENLEFLWLQLDQNVREKDSKANLRNPNRVLNRFNNPAYFASQNLKKPFDGGFNIEYVKDASGNPLPYTINWTMMRIDLPTPLASGQQVSFSIKWWYNINDRMKDGGGRSGYESFPEDGNNLYTIAQFFPRMAVYSDVEGWQNHQFWGNGEFALPFGNYQVNITVPADHVLDATGELTNRKEVFSREMMKRYNQAKKSFDKPVFIVTEEEAIEAEKGFSDKKKTWKFSATNVRDFAFASSRKFIWDMQAVDINGRTVMAVSLYPKEGNPLWEDLSTKVVASTLKTYSKFTFDYPYHKAISVHTARIGMEYPMICFNYGRPLPDGTIPERTKYGMIGVIIHEVGHNFFPMIVNSDERQWGWMDEGINTFVQYLAEQEFGERHPDVIAPYKEYPSRRGPAKNIVSYMSADQSTLSPIMSNPENVFQLGPNAYSKPATGLNILRETIMGPELFDHAFATYSKRWMFKHPTPEDFFRTMEDASAVDLDWFWRGWFYSTDYVDLGVKEVKQYRMTDDGTPLKDGEKVLMEEMPSLKEFLDNLTDEQKATIDTPKYFYEVTYEKKGGIPMPLIVEFSYKDGTREVVKYPAELWRKNDKQVSRVMATNKEVVGIVVDPMEETADIDTSNNNWPKEEKSNEFEQFKNEVKG